MLTYNELEFPTFVNSSNAMTLIGYRNQTPQSIQVPFSDIPKILTLIGGAYLCLGDTRCGKLQLMMDIHRYFFGGDADNGGKSTWMVARNDFSEDSFFITIDQNKIGENKGMLSQARSA
ncbi:MAG TPA: hypothetical protein VJB89_02680 [Candidatus Nanoarchaeia archaeon]|nr:hypothetical protein [Candidatus Nanoarchaeia archaeon]